MLKTLLAALVLPALIACSDSGQEQDAGRDAGRDVAAPDTRAPDLLPLDAPPPDLPPPDATGDRTGETGPVVDAGPDLPPPDAVPWPDYGPLPKYTLSFAHGASSAAMAVASIKTDGTGYTTYSSYGTLYFGYYTYLYGRLKEYYPISRDVPQQEVKLPYYPIYLPGGLGYVRWFRDSVASTVGVMVYKTDGSLKVLYTTPGSSNSDLYYYFTASTDGKLVATHRPGKGLVLIRTDGSTFTSGKPAIELDPSTSPGTIMTMSPAIGAKYVYMVTNSGTGYSLWRATTDGKTAIQALTLPKVNNLTPTWVDDEIAVSDNGKVAVVTAGASSSSEDVIALHDDGRMVNLSKSPGQWYERYYTWGYAGSGCQLEVSPSGKYVAAVKYDSGSYNLYVMPADGSSSPVLATDSSNISLTSTPYVHTFSLKFVDDDRLLMTLYGSSNSYNDVFLYTISTKTLTNLTKQNSSSRPYALGSSNYFRTYGMWLSPTRKWLYMVAYYRKLVGSSYVYARDLWGIELATGKRVEITSGADVYTSYDAFASCPGSSRVFFCALPKMGTGTARQLFTYEMDKATPAVQLTSLTAPAGASYSYIYDITPSPDCTWVAFRSGYSNTYDLYAGQVTPKGTFRNLTNGAASTYYSYVYDQIVIPKDNSQVIYLHGTQSSNMVLRRLPLQWPAHKPEILHTGLSSVTYWYLFGIK
jgi:Tol biopolymer transport system component